jgi:hypothetical protein
LRAGDYFEVGAILRQASARWLGSDPTGYPDRQNWLLALPYTHVIYRVEEKWKFSCFSLSGISDFDRFLLDTGLK